MKPTDKPYDSAAQRRIEKAIPWCEHMTWVKFKNEHNSAICFRGDTYQAHADELLQWLARPHGIDQFPVIGRDSGGLELGDDMRIGRLTLRHATDVRYMWGFLSVPQVMPHRMLTHVPVCNRGREVGHVSFDSDTESPALFGGHSSYPWMSYTFSETMSQYSGIRAARGSVVIGGLGLGWLTRRVAEQPRVGEVVVVERNAALAEFVRPALASSFGNRVKVVVADIYDYLKGVTKKSADTVLMDIWRGYGDGTDDRKWLTERNRLQSDGIKTWEWA